MKTGKTLITVAAGIALALGGGEAHAQPPVITSFHSNGQLTWTNSPGTNGFTVQWASSLSGSWSSEWRGLDALIVTSTQSTVAVPIFYRVAKGFSLASQRGVWIATGPFSQDGQNASLYYVAQDDGIISESGSFGLSGPAGFFTVDSSGRVTNTLVYRHSAPVVAPGIFAGPNQILLDPPYTGTTVRRVEDITRCAGAWTGTLFQTNVAYGSTTNYPVTFNVDNRGLVADLTGFQTNSTGRVFALTNGTVAAFFFTAADDDYDQIRVSGTLSGNTVLGTFENNSDFGILGFVVLSRH